jgi:hypothetical protein
MGAGMNKLKTLIWLILLFALGVPAWATTTLRLHLASAGTTGYQGMSLSLGPFGNTVQTSVTYTTASGTHIQATQTGGGSVLAWMSEPFSGSVTMSGTETMNFYGKEASAANNASVEFDLYKYSGGSLGSAFCTGVWGTELTTSIATHAPTCSASSTSFSAGDRLVVELYIVNCATSGCPSGTMAAGLPGVTIDYDGATSGSDGDTNLSTAETISFTPVGGSGGTPSCSLFTDQTEPNSAGFPSAGYTQIYLPRTAGTNNAIIVGATGSPGDTVTVTDDQGDTFYLGAYNEDTTNAQTIQLFYAVGVNGSSRQIQVHHSASDSWFAPLAFVCTNVATATALDVSTGHFASSNTVTAGSVTPNYSGDLWVQMFWNDYSTGAQSTISAGSQTNITWALAQTDRSESIGTQWGVYSSTSALNPTMSTTGTAGFNSVAIALKSSSAGTSFPSGIQPTAMKTFWISSSGQNQGSLPRTEQFPCSASNDGIIVQWLGGSGDTLTSVTDSNSNSYSSTGSAVCASGAGGCSSTYYAQNATVGPGQSLTLNGTAGVDSAKLFCVSGGSTTSFFDKTATATGDQTTAGNLTGVSITPSTANGLVVSDLSISDNTQAGLTAPSGVLFVGCLWSVQSVNPQGCDENNGWSVFSNPGSSSYTFTWSPRSAFPSTAAGPWVNRADAFEAAGSSTHPPGAFPRVF